MIRKIVFYKKEDGSIPVESFLDSLSDKVVKKILAVLRLVDNIDQIPSKYFKKLTNTNIWNAE